MWRSLFARCAEVGGPIHVHVAAEVCGLRPATIRARASREGWWQPYRDVVAPPGTRVDGRAWALAAIARLQGPDPHAPAPVALARWSAAAALGVGPGWPTRVQVVVPVDRLPVSGPRLEVVRSRTFDPRHDLEVVGRPGVAALGPPALARSLAAVADVPALTDVVTDLVQSRKASIADIVADHQRHRTYPGRPTLTEVLARLGAAGRTDSGLELHVRRELLAAGIPLDVGQVAIPCRDGRTLHLDLGIARIRFGVEVTSMLGHSTRRQLRVDAIRSNQLARVDDDWRVLQASWEDRGSGEFVALAREVVAAQSQRHLGRPWPV